MSHGKENQVVKEGSSSHGSSEAREVSSDRQENACETLKQEDAAEDDNRACRDSLPENIVIEVVPVNGSDCGSQGRDRGRGDGRCSGGRGRTDRNGNWSSHRRRRGRVDGFSRRATHAHGGQVEAFDNALTHYALVSQQRARTASTTAHGAIWSK